MAKPIAGVLLNSLPSASTETGEIIAQQLQNDGWDVRRLTPEGLCRDDLVRADALDLLVLTDAGRLPADAGRVLDAYLDAGGRLLSLGAPLFAEPYARDGESWLSKTDYDEARNRLPAEFIIEKFDSEDLPSWTRAASDHDGGANYQTVEAGARDESDRCLHVTIDHLTSYDVFALKALPGAIPADHSLTCFWAKGSADTHHLSLEWTEKDGSIWLTSVPLFEEWTHYALPPQAFKFQRSNWDREHCRLNLPEAESFRMFIAMSHLGTPGHNEYWVDEFGTAPDPWLARGLSWDVQCKPREALFPAYKFYPCDDVATVRTTTDQAWLPAHQPLTLPAKVQAMHPRPQGTGYDRNRPWRWTPVVEALGPDGEYRGALGVVMGERETGAQWAALTMSDPGYYEDETARQLVSQLADNLRKRPFLLEAGATQYTYFPDQEIHLGAQLQRRPLPGREPVQVTFRVFNNTSTIVYEHEERVEWSSEAITDVSIKPADAFVPQQGHIYTVETTLTRPVIGAAAPEILDVIRHELCTWEPQGGDFVTVEDGDFIRNGQPWFVHSMNYMPSSGIGVEDGDYFEYWLEDWPYGPEIIQRDLQRQQAMGLNAICVFTDHRSKDSWNLLDFMRRCEALDLKINLNIRPVSPTHFDKWPAEKVLAVIEQYRLKDNDVLFAYDLDWEPQHGPFERRMRHAPQWTAYVTNRYGSLDAAVEAWGTDPGRTDDLLQVPTDEQVFNKGPWVELVADYRAFLDDWLASAYGRARELIHKVDPNHLLSFRMNNTGNPTFKYHPLGIPYDPVGLGRVLDFMGPEAYGRLGDWRLIKHGVFTVAYCRAAAPGQPVYWTEAGLPVWDGDTMAPDPRRLEVQARFYEDFYKMMLMSHSNGIAWWWYAGGFRVNEKSDFGIINPDGTDRPATKIIRQYAHAFINQGKTPAPDVVFDVDRKLHPTAEVGIYEEVYDDFWKHTDDGKLVGLQLAPTQPEAR